MIYWTNLTRKLTGMKRGLTILHGGAPTNGQKRNLSNKPPSVIADVRPSGSAGDSATARLWIFLFRLFAVRACACLGERSEPTCIRQAHATVPKGNLMTKNRRIYTGFYTKSKESLNLKQRIDNCFFKNLCYNISTPMITL